MTTEGNIETVQ